MNKRTFRNLQRKYLTYMSYAIPFAVAPIDPEIEMEDYILQIVKELGMTIVSLVLAGIALQLAMMVYLSFLVDMAIFAATFTLIWPTIQSPRRVGQFIWNLIPDGDSHEKPKNDHRVRLTEDGELEAYTDHDPLTPQEKMKIHY